MIKTISDDGKLIHMSLGVPHEIYENDPVVKRLTDDVVLNLNVLERLLNQYDKAVRSLNNPYDQFDRDNALKLFENAKHSPDEVEPANPYPLDVNNQN